MNCGRYKEKLTRGKCYGDIVIKYYTKCAYFIYEFLLDYANLWDYALTISRRSGITQAKCKRDLATKLNNCLNYKIYALIVNFITFFTVKNTFYFF